MTHGVFYASTIGDSHHCFAHSLLVSLEAGGSNQYLCLFVVTLVTDNTLVT
jgi:hypothetical protein